jgi:hypothetical protein
MFAANVHQSLSVCNFEQPLVDRPLPQEFGSLANAMDIEPTCGPPRPNGGQRRAALSGLHSIVDSRGTADQEKS